VPVSPLVHPPASAVYDPFADEPSFVTVPVRKAANLTEFTWHCLRHTFASRLVMAGVDIRTVQELMGHKTIAMTVRYAHLAPKHTQAAVEKLDTPIGQPTDTTTDTGALPHVAVEKPMLQQVIH
jgi:Phage integrase family